MLLNTAISAAVVLEQCKYLVTATPKDSFNLQKVMLQQFDSPYHSSTSSLTFVHKSAPDSLVVDLRAALVMSERKLESNRWPWIRVKNIYETMRVLLDRNKHNFTPVDEFARIHGMVAKSAIVYGTIEKDCVVSEGCFVGKGSLIRSGTMLEPNVTVLDNCEIGANSVIQSGVVIGSAGFNFYEFNNATIHLPHYGGVSIGSDVFVGANSVIASGVLNPTRIGNGCKLDSHIQIAHNVELGEECMLASQSGIAGSTRVGARVKIGGAASLSGHLVIGDDVSIAAKSGVTKHIKSGAVVAGYPARDLKEWKQQKIYLKNKANKSR
ncbi:MAG: UDP-3-O-(3-hydroxymyristoyl)glucosamine N-acyltransferase [Fibrobacteria bacterium]|nr:UDP-3-O-(3-hydroxymyristoyl)glucosamine N-acyltransferase [Fibrobacteria bacterium]